MIALLWIASVLASPVAGDVALAAGRTRTPAEREAVLGNYDVAPRVEKQTEAKYPDRAFREALEAEIHVEFVVDEKGEVRDVEVTRMKAPAPGSRKAVEGFYKAAAECVRQWRFQPATKDGRPVATLAMAPIRFRIQGTGETPPKSKRTDADRQAYEAEYDVPPRVTKLERVKYPPRAFKEKAQGTIEVEFVIDEQGRVRDPEVLSGNTKTKGGSLSAVYDLYQEALAVVQRWTFEPARKDGKPVATLARAPVIFRLY